MLLRTWSLWHFLLLIHISAALCGCSFSNQFSNRWHSGTWGVRLSRFEILQLSDVSVLPEVQSDFHGALDTLSRTQELIR